MSSQEDKRILGRPTAFLGEIILADRAFPVEFELQTDDFYNLSIRFSKAEPDLIRAVQANSGGAGESIPTYSISGKSQDGSEFSSKDFSPGHTNGDALTGELYNAEVYIPRDEPVIRLGYECWIRGFQAWDATRIDTPLGIAGVEASLRLEDDRQKVTARMAVICDDGPNPDDWLANVIPFMRHMHAGLSFIDGGWVSIPLRRFCSPDGNRWFFHKVNSSEREFPPEHALNNKAMMEALIQNYFSDDRVKHELWDAVSWMYLPTTNNEGRFLGAMTAIELWLSLEFDSEEDFVHASKDEFAKLFFELLGAVQTSDMPQSLKDGACRKLMNLRQLSLNRKISVAFERTGISRIDISSSALKKLVSRRNKMIHEGKWLENEEDWEMVFLAREIITRIVLHTLRFEGSYDSFLGGCSHRRKFPDCTRQN